MLSLLFKFAPPSPSTSTSSSMASGLSRPSGNSTPFMQPTSHIRRPSEQVPAAALFRNVLGIDDGEDGLSRRNSLPSRLNRPAFGSQDRTIHSNSADFMQRQTRSVSANLDHTPASSVSSPSFAAMPLPSQVPLPEGVEDKTNKTASPRLGHSTATPAWEKTVDCLIAEDSKPGDRSTWPK